jgi:LPXTG-motif cell wall-anchored protein
MPLDLNLSASNSSGAKSGGQFQVTSGSGGKQNTVVVVVAAVAALAAFGLFLWFRRK